MNTNQEKIYYKVVTDKLQSCIINQNLNTDNKKYCVTYKEGEFVYPILKNSKLMVFNTFDNANIFIRNKDKNFIYSCNILKPI